MAVALVLLTAVFWTVLNSTRRDLEEQSLRTLHQAAAGPGLPGLPGQTGSAGLQPWFTLERLPDGRLLATGSEQFDLSDEPYLRELFTLAEEAEPDSGLLPGYDLRYLRERSPFGTRYAFADISAQRDTLRNLAVTCLLIGLAASAVFFLAALLLARWMVRPVEEAWDRQRQFVADASHELKTPLTVILTNSELLDSDVEATRRQAAEGIRTMSGQMRGLVEGLLDLARVDDGAVASIQSRVDVSLLAEEASLTFEALFFEQGLTLSAETEAGCSVMGSESHLRQVTDILLDNARKYAHPGTEVILSLRRDRNHCLLTVANKGDPLSADDLKNIFKRFYRGDRARAMDGSYGLGLSIAESIVHTHKGKIWAESADGVNTFSVQLPLSE